MESTGSTSPRKKKRISINSSTTLLDLQENQTVNLKIVSPPLSNPEDGKISFLSPLGAELIDKKVGDMISVNFLGTKMRFKILDFHQ
jgi:transcription elongation factor GreA